MAAQDPNHRGIMVDDLARGRRPLGSLGGVAEFAVDDNGNVTGLVGPDTKTLPIKFGNPSPRPTLLCFGNSIAGQNSRLAAAYTTTATAVAVRAGANQITLVAGGVAALGLVVNDYIAVALKDQSLWVVQVTGIAGEVLTLANRVPTLLRDVGAGVNKVTAPVFWSSNQRLGLGFVNVANALLGGPCHILQGYGYGSGYARNCLNDLPIALKQWNPNYVFFILLENDVVGSSSYQRLVDDINFAARTCLNAGAVPIFEYCLPSNSITAGARATVFDQINSYLGSISTTIPGAYSINHGALYLDPAKPTLRTPLAGWTDGVHPNGAYQLAIAQAKLSEMQAIIGRRDTPFGLFGVNPRLTGTAGTKTGTGTFLGSSVAPDNTTITLLGAGVRATTLKNSSDELMVDFTITGASDITATQLQISQTISGTTETLTMSPSTWVKAVVRLRVTDMQRVSMPNLTITFGGVNGDVRGAGDFTKLTTLSNSLLVLETQAIPLRDPAASSISIQFNLRPETLADGSVVHFSGVIEEFGYEVTNAKDIEYTY